jgi:hypothetical protein
VDDLQKYVDVLKTENEQLRGADTTRSGSANVKRVSVRLICCYRIINE